MTVQDQIADTLAAYSCTHKDAYGFRPTSIPTFDTVAEAEAHMEHLYALIADSLEEKRLKEQEVWRAIVVEIRDIMHTLRSGPSCAIRVWFDANGFEAPEATDDYRPSPGHYQQNAEQVLWNRGVPMSKWHGLTKRMIPA